MQSDYWNEFYQTGRVSDYLKYVDSARNTADTPGSGTGNRESSKRMESVNDAGKGDRYGAFGNTGW